MKQTPLEMQVRARVIKPLDEINHSGSGAKRRRHIVRSLLQPQIMMDTQECNKVDGGGKRLHGEKSR